MFFHKKKNRKSGSVSSEYEIIARAADPRTAGGWFDPEVAARQHSSFQFLIHEARAGRIRRDFHVAAEALARTGLAYPSILETGCASGYYCEILSYLLNRDLNYFGIDNSPAMIALAKTNYPEKCFIRGDATLIPFRNGSFDVVFNGVSLMHTQEYEKAISESRRTANSWCIFHTVPLLQERATTTIKKTAYGGEPVLEMIFNEAELLNLFEQNELQIKWVTESIPYDLEELLNEKTVTKTYLCEVSSA